MLPLCALVLPVLLIACGLAIDLGLMENHALTMQQAADAAAASAELELERGTGNWVAVGKATAALNGFRDGQGSVTVVVSMAPATGAFAGERDAVRVAIKDDVATIFLRLADEQAAGVTASAVALVPPCFYLTGGKTAMTSVGSTLALKCPLYVDRGVTVDGSSSVSAMAENMVGSAGESSGSMTPAAHFGAAAMADPLAAIPEPATGACAHTGFKQSGGVATLSPGTYCEGMTLTNATVTLQPGQYVITGGAHWSGSTVQGTGVTLFFTKRNRGGGWAVCGRCQLACQPVGAIEQQRAGRHRRVRHTQLDRYLNPGLPTDQLDRAHRRHLVPAGVWPYADRERLELRSLPGPRSKNAGDELGTGDGCGGLLPHCHG